MKLSKKLKGMIDDLKEDQEFNRQQHAQLELIIITGDNALKELDAAYKEALLFEAGVE